MEQVKDVKLAENEKLVSLADITEGQLFRFQTDCVGVVRVAQQVGRTEIYAPYRGQNTIGHSKGGGEEVYLRSDNRDVILLPGIDPHSNPITRKAERIRLAKRIEDENNKEKIEREARETRQYLENEFREAFPNVLPLLKELGIEFRGGMQDDRYQHMGTFIEFIHGSRRLKMDFSNRGSYRYEFVEYNRSINGHYGNSTYGKWKEDGLFLFLDEKLINIDN